MLQQDKNKHNGSKFEKMLRNSNNKKSLMERIKKGIGLLFIHIGILFFNNEKTQLMPLLAANNETNIRMYRDKDGYLVFETATDVVNAISSLFETLRREIIAEKILIANTVPYNGNRNDVKIHQKSYGRMFRGLPFIGAMWIYVAHYTKPEGGTFTSNVDDVILPKHWYTKYVMFEGVAKWIRKLSLRNTRNSLQRKYGINISHITIWNYAQYLAKSANEKGVLGGLVPKLVGIFHMDEIYVKVKGGWHYLWLATDPKTKIIGGWALTTSRCKEGAKELLESTLTVVDEIKIGITDIWPAYKAAANELELKIRWQYCVLHAMHNVVDKRIKEGLIGASDETIEKIKSLRLLVEHLFFVSNSMKDANKTLKEIFKLRKEFDGNADILYIFMFLEKNEDELLLHLKERDVHRTNNIAEFVNGEFKRRYKLIGSFQKIDAAKNFIILYLIYYNFHKFERKRISRTREIIQNKSPMEYGGELVGSWLEYLNIGPPPSMCDWSLHSIEF